MTVFEPAKRKAPPIANRRFQAGLFIWTILSVLACVHPLVWFAPPHEKMTPYIYYVASVLWLPFGIRHARRYGLPYASMVLIAAGCTFAALLLTYVPRPYVVPQEWDSAVYAQLYGVVALAFLVILLAWVPFAVRHVRRYRLPWLTILLIAGAIGSTGSFVTAGHFVHNLIRDSSLAPVDSMLAAPFIQYGGAVAWHIIELTGLEGFPIAILTKLEAWSCCSLF
jgi:hypothetical protein